MKKTQVTDEQTQYIWWKDKKIYGIMLLLLTASFQIFAFLEIPIMTSLHGYTVGMVFGFYNPFFYVFITAIALQLIANNKIYIPKWLRLKWSTYWIMVISILFISASSGYYQVKNGWFVFGGDSWLSFGKWFADFTSKNNAFIPANTNAGIIGVFLYSFFAMIFTGIGAFIIAVLSILIPASLLFTGTFWGLYRKIIRRKMLYKSKKKSQVNPLQPPAQINHSESIEPSSMQMTSSDNQVLKNDDILVNTSPQDTHEEPFDDPFN